MKTFRKAIALILSMLVLLTVSPLAAFAEGEATEGAAGPEAAWFTSYGIRRGEGTLAEAAASVNAGGRILLLTDVTDFDEAITFTHNVTLEGDGYTITRSETFGGVMFTVSNNSTLNIKNVTINGNVENYPGIADTVINVTSGQLTLGSGTVITANNAGFSNGGAVRAGTADATSAAAALVLMSAGSEISDCSASNGGAVYLDNKAQMVMNGGTISGCKAVYDGGAVAVAKSTATFTMAGGTITGCECSLTSTGYAGSAVYAGYGKTAITGGTITGNTNTSDLGALYVALTAEVSVGNAAYIFGNNGNVTESNIYIEKNAVLNINPALTEGAKLGVSTYAKYKKGDTIVFDFINVDTDVMGYIYNDADGSTFQNANGLATLIQCITVSFNPGNGTCPVESKLYAVDAAFGKLPECDDRDGFEFLGWYTDADVLVTESSTVSFYDDITLHAKWENLNKIDNSPLSVIGRFFERIGELMRSVFEFLENLFTGNGSDALENIDK